jgi:hypothetical protein
MSTTQGEAGKAEAVAPSQAVVERVAGCEGVDHTELVPLFDAIDPDALNKLVERDREKGSALRITFTYHGYDVTVTGDAVHLDGDEAVDG